MRNVVLETHILRLFSFYVTVSQVCLLKSYLFKKKNGTHLRYSLKKP